MDGPSECELELEVLHCSGTRTPRTYEHRQLKSHGNSLNCHGKVMEKSWNYIIRLLWEPCNLRHK